MKICIAQIHPKKGDIPVNIEKHKSLIKLCLTINAEAIFFPELSLTGYEPELANELAFQENDIRLDIFQEISDNSKIIIGLGLPIKTKLKPKISMLMFEPYKPRYTYSKQQLHFDEFPYFDNGLEQILIKKDTICIAPAICYESLQPIHVENAFKLGANVYLTSVAKPENGFKKANIHYPEIAKKYKIPILMANCIGFCDNFLSVGKSSVWSKDGKLISQLDEISEGILIYDTKTEEASLKILEF